MEILPDEEYYLLTSASLFAAKWSLEDKIQKQLENSSLCIKDFLLSISNDWPTEITDIPPKISRGQNYLGFPWMILDHPRYFTKSDVFAIRTLCWWTQGISCTLQLSGKYLNHFYPLLQRKASEFSDSGYYICINQDPWHHHFGDDNYQLLNSSADPESLMKAAYEQGFIKLMSRHPVTDIFQLPAIAETFIKSVFS